MSTERDTTRIVRSWLEEGRTTLPDWVRDDVFDRLPATPQRRSGGTAWRFRSMNVRATLAVGMVAVAVLAVAGLSLLPRQSPPSAPSSTPTEAPSPELARDVPYVISGPVSGPGAIPVESGTYRMRGAGGSEAGWPGAVIVTIPDQWYASSAVRGSGLKRTEDGRLAALNFGDVGNLFADPCASGEDRGPMLVPPIGPSVDDMVAGLRSRPVLEFSEPVDVTLDGWAGKRLELTHPAGCGTAALWLTPAVGEQWEIYSREGWHSTIWILDVNGIRFVVIASLELDAPPSVRLELQRMVDSIDIRPS